MPDFLETAIRAAIEAGKAIMEVYDSPETDWEVERKADNSPLTLADRRAHAVIVRHLAQTGLPVLSEEGSHAPFGERQGWQRLWVVDPLDGTKEFLKRNGEFTVNIALVEDGTPRMGVIYVPASRTLYYGRCGGTADGAWRTEDVTTEHASAADAMHRAVRLPLPENRRTGQAYTVIASRSHLSPETAACIERLSALHERVETRPAGSSLKFCLLAERTADFYPRFAPTMEWDTAAGDAILRGAGGHVVRTDDHQPLAYNKADLHNPYFEASAPEA